MPSIPRNLTLITRRCLTPRRLDRGIDVLITNPELVKNGLDLLEFPTMVFMQSGYNVYSLQQAARRSWRIGQKLAVKVIYLGYAATS